MTLIPFHALAQPVSIPASLRDLEPARHFKNMTTTGTPVVVIMGDSIATDAPTVTHDEGESLWGRLQRRLARSNRDRTFTFYNRAIGGATWTNAIPSTTLAATGLTLPSWAGAGANSWITDVASLTPTMVILHFGMNDAQNIGAHNVKAVIDGLRSALPLVDIVICTPMVPARNTSNTSISSTASQNGRVFGAHYLRTLAISRGFGLIDIGRYQARAVQGVDPCETKTAGGTATARSLTSATTYSYTAPTTQGDAGMKIEFTASAPFWSGKRLRLSTSTAGTDAPNSYSFAEVYDNAGSVALDLVTYTPAGGGVDVDRVTVTSGITTPTSGAQTLTMFFKGDWASVKLNGVTVYEGLCVRLGGTFAPVLTITGASATTSLTITDYPATYLPTLPMLTDVQMWGDPNIADSIEGGNGLNHPTSQGFAAVIAPVLDALDFHIPSYNEGATFFPSTAGRSMGVGTAASLATLHVRKAANGGTYVNVGGRSVMVIEDDDLALLQLLTGAAGSAGIEMGPATNPNEGGVIYSAGTGNTTIRADDLDALVALNPGTASQAGLQLLVNRAGTVTLSPVTIGAADSGGAGFRLLNVPNT